MIDILQKCCVNCHCLGCSAYFYLQWYIQPALYTSLGCHGSNPKLATSEYDRGAATSDPGGATKNPDGAINDEGGTSSSPGDDATKINRRCRKVE